MQSHARRGADFWLDLTRAGIRRSAFGLMALFAIAPAGAQTRGVVGPASQPARVGGRTVVVIPRAGAPSRASTPARGGTAASPPGVVIPGRHDLVPGTAAPPVAPTPAVQAIITQLGDDDFSKRESATDALVQMGPSIIPQLRGAMTENLPPEAFVRLDNTIKRLDSMSQVWASSITIHEHNVPLINVLRQLAYQSDADIVVNGQDDKLNTLAMSLDLDNANYWDALRQITDAAKLSPMMVNDHLQLDAGPPPYGAVQYRPRFKGPSTIAGPFFIQPLQTDMSRSVDYDTGKKSSQVSMRVALFCEPKLMIVGNRLDFSNCQATDDHDQLLIPMRDVQPFSAGQGRAAWFLSMGLAERPGMGGQFNSVKGVVTLDAESVAHVVKINDLAAAAGKSIKAGDSTITVAAVNPANGNQPWIIEVQIASPAVDASQIGLDPSREFLNAMKLTDDKDQPLETQLNAAGGGPSPMGIVTVVRMIVRAGVPATLNIDVPSAPVHMSVPFELKKVDVPVNPPS
jgi:hypothetical protein